MNLFTTMVFLGFQLTLEFQQKIRKLFREELLSLEHHTGKERILVIYKS